MSRKSHLHSTTTKTSPEKRLEFEKFLADLSAKFVALPPEEVDHEIRKALHEVLGFFRIDRCSLLRFLPGKTMRLIAHNADIAGVSPYPIETPMPVSFFPYLSKRLMEKHEAYSFARIEDLTEEAASERQALETWKVRSGLYIPIAALRSAAEKPSSSSGFRNGARPGTPSSSGQR